MRRADPVLDRIVLTTLAIMSLMGGASMTLLAIIDRPYPPALTALVGAATGVMLGWFGHHRACGASERSERQR